MAENIVLVVDDEPEMLDICQEILQELDDVVVHTSNDSKLALARIEEQVVDLLVVDILMPGLSGLDLLRRVRELDPNLPVLLMTAFPTVDTAVQALRLGAADYLTKPFHPDELLENARRLLDQLRLRSEHRLLARHVGRDFLFGDMVGASTEMLRTFDLIDRIAPQDAPVLIVGETGTGKELVARAIHQRSPAAAERFVPVDCGAIPENLLESEFFGHEAGAFTGTQGRAIGLMEYADGGVFFLDEVAELPLRMQAKLLRALQEKVIRRVGGKREIPVNIRLIAATNRNIEGELGARTFREDLYYRLSGFRVDVPPLRERNGDIPLLLTHFLKCFADESDRPVLEVDAEALEVLTSYEWPGNVRELQNVLRQTIALSHGSTIGINDLPERIVLNTRSKRTQAGGFFEQRSSHMEKFEREYFGRILGLCEGNVSRAAEMACLPRGTLYRLLRRCDLNPKDFRARG